MTADPAIRRQRQSRGLSQHALAEAAGISRQALLAIESGRSVPSVTVALALARVLERSVEDLFEGLRTPTIRVPALAFNPGDRVGLVYHNGQYQAYALDSPSPADGVVIRRRAKHAQVELLRPAPNIRDNLVLGGCAPAMNVLASRLTRQRCEATYRPMGTWTALRELSRGGLHVAGVHPGQVGHESLDLASDGSLPAEPRAITLAHWDLGLVVAPGNPHRIVGLEDLQRSQLRIVRREEGSAVARLLEPWFAARSRDGSSKPRRRSQPAAAAPHSRPPIVHSHREVGLAVAWGHADVGVTIPEVARALDLPFLPISQERFDLVYFNDLQSDPRIVRLSEHLQSLTFRRELQALGYDTRSTGTSVRPRE